jgi:hypothetical protein
MRAGDTISGTVVVQPTSEGSLSRYVVEIAGTGGPASRRVFKFVVPAGPAMDVVLKNGSRAEVDRAAVPIIGSARTTHYQFALPRIGQNGRPLEIPGRFDGDSSTTRVNVGGVPMPILAESPRKAVIEVPREPAGNTNITITDRGRVGTSGFRIVGVSLSAPKAQLKKGEKTTLSVRLVGLEGIKNEVALDLETMGVVETEGGNTQRIKIQPIQVQPDGTVTLTRAITGITPGNFTVVATVIDPKRNPE